ncbi:MAG TPA: ATP-dependent DNA ligase [Phycisphaerales bacterium]|nr:ATP-dependent DNA ligase [Phycisphaerales bacterium]
MQAFTALYEALDASTGTNDKVRALVAYFERASPHDAAWAAWILTGGRVKRAVSHTDLRLALHEATNLPEWLISESYEAVGDLSETISLLLPDEASGEPLSLADAMETIISPLRDMKSEQKRETLRQVWTRLPTSQRFVFHKLISGSFRVGVSRTLAVRALAQVAKIDQAEMAHRVMGTWQPTAADYAKLLSPQASDARGAQPYPFYLASPLEQPVESLGDVREWQAEWKWDGIRAQVIARDGRVTIWSRGEDMLSDRFTDLTSVLERLPDGCVLDGEILAWEPGAARPLPFSDLQLRIGKTSQARHDELLFVDTPVRFATYDLLEHSGEDIRIQSLATRREKLANIVHALRGEPVVSLSPVIAAQSWSELAELRASSRERGVEGLMLKRLASAYGTGRERGDWWKWKIEPFTIDAVLIAAQPGSGRRASVFTDYTFAVWTGETPGTGELVTIAKAYSGLTDVEIDRVDAFVRANTISRHGPVRAVKPTMVFELAFEGLQESNRHKSGIALRFPRIARIRDDKTPQQADTVASVRALMRVR